MAIPTTERSALISKSLVAYATIASSGKDIASIYTAFQPYIVECITGNQKRIADPKKISTALKSRFGLDIPPMAVEGLFPGLCQAGVLTYEHVGQRAIYELSIDVVAEISSHTAVDRTSEAEVRDCLSRIEDHVVAALNANQLQFDPDTLREEIRRAIVAPATIRETKSVNGEEVLSLESAIEFFTLEYASICEINGDKDFDIITRISAGGMAVNFLEAFALPSLSPDRHRAKVFFDTKILISLCDFSDTESRSYYASVKEKLEKINVEICAFSENVDETVDVIVAVISKLNAGESPSKEVGFRLSRDKGALVRAQAFRSNPTSYLKKLGIKIYDVKKDYAHLEKNFPYSQEENLIPDIRRFGEVRSRAVDAAVVANIGRLLRSASRSSVDIFSTPYICVSPNTPFVAFAESVLQEGHYTRDGYAPGFITDVQFATAVWLNSGIGELSIPRSRLLASCAALVSSNSQIFDKVREFLKEVNEDDAKFFTAQIEENRSALLVASRFVAHPSAINQETSYEVLRQVKEQIRRDEEDKLQVKIEELIGEHQEEISGITQVYEDRISRLDGSMKTASQQAADVQERLLAVEIEKEGQSQEFKKYKGESEARQDALEKRLKEESKKKFLFLVFIVIFGILYAAAKEFGGLGWEFEKSVDVLGYMVSEGSISIIVVLVNLLASVAIAKITSHIL